MGFRFHMSRPATLEEKVYAAGLFDGEGCIDVVVRSTHNRAAAVSVSHCPRAHINITNKEVLLWLKSIWGGTISDRKNLPAHWKPAWCWMMGGENAIRFIRDIEPWLIIKHSQAKVVLKFQTRVSRRMPLTQHELQQRQQIKEQLHILKATA